VNPDEPQSESACRSISFILIKLTFLRANREFAGDLLKAVIILREFPED